MSKRDYRESHGIWESVPSLDEDARAELEKRCEAYRERREAAVRRESSMIAVMSLGRIGESDEA